MKVRIKIKSSRELVNLEENASLNNLIEAILTKLEGNSFAKEDIVISLNGKVPLEEDTSSSLASIGIVNGDLVHVLTTKDCPPLHSQMESETVLAKKACVKQEGEPQSMEVENEATGSRNQNNPGAPIFLHEGVTPFLAELYKGSHPETTHDAFFLALKTLVYEGGLKAQVIEESGNPQHTNFWSFWKRKGGVYKIPLVLPGYPNAASAFAAVSVGPYVAVNVHISMKEPKLFQTKFRVDRYVRGDIPLQQGPVGIYQNLRELSRLFKDRIIFPLLAEFRNSLDIPVPVNSLLGVPAEIKCLVLKLLDVQSLLKITETSKELYFAGNDNELWRQICQRDFGYAVPSENSQAWKEIYVSLHRQKKDDEKRKAYLAQRQGIPFHSPLIGTSSFPYFGAFGGSFAIPGIRGGVHDLFPVYPRIPSFNDRQSIEDRMRPRTDPVYPNRDLPHSIISMEHARSSNNRFRLR